ncbi:hypothetical protein RGQ13_01715 [Thalassotalea psychrophila]|uniref:Uncharacterized protein n=1 Tax=Thalassotalea psychrophila TaxID=3065647 RepID=A0ABY9TZ21_9GAMM|nr:hypothetical protein RGQ13_01715 [Colwelliaceae bacterium SQ149]
MKPSTIEFLSKDMCIDIHDLKIKLGSEGLNNHSSQIESFLNRVVDLFNENSDSKKIVELINNEFNYFCDDLNEDSFEVLDSMRHAFTTFSNRSIKNLYFEQENQCWYPNIVLSSVVDKAELEDKPDTLIVYRGCDVKEMFQEVFEQSWTISKDVAKDFAFKHYQYENWFSSANRVVLEAKIDKSQIYLSRLYHHEKEVVVNPSALQNVQQST